MTLIIALKYKEGSVLATDSRVMYGSIKRDQARKIEPLTDDIGLATAGLVGAIDDIIRPAKDLCNSRPTTFEDVCSKLSDESLKWYKENVDKLDEDDEQSLSEFIVVSAERIRKIQEKGYSEESYDYDCVGSGSYYGEYILQNFYRGNLDVKEAKELAVYTILETSKMDPSVGQDIQMNVYPKGEKYQSTSKEEIAEIKAHQAPLSRDVMNTYTKTVESIVNLREELNNLWGAKFGFKLLSQNEKAVFQIAKLCRSETDFTNNIAALALLIDQLNLKEMENFEKKEGSINILESFLHKEFEIFPPEILSNLRDIMIMRSKKFPTHVTDPKFVDVVVKITGKYPPNWSELYLKALDMYSGSLSKLLGCLQK
jgi:20S proteasome alpha/beta subunit